MSKQTVIVLTDDLDGSKGDETYAFTWQGVPYEIDLSKRNGKEFEKLMGRYVEAGRRVKGGDGRTGKPRSGKRERRSDLAAIRLWAANNGHAVSDRGRIPQDVLDAYDMAQS